MRKYRYLIVLGLSIFGVTAYAQNLDRIYAYNTFGMNLIVKTKDHSFKLQEEDTIDLGSKADLGDTLSISIDPNQGLPFQKDSLVLKSEELFTAWEQIQKHPQQNVLLVTFENTSAFKTRIAHKFSARSTGLGSREEGQTFKLRIKNLNPYPIFVAVVGANHPQAPARSGLLNRIADTTYNLQAKATGKKTFKARIESQKIAENDEVNLDVIQKTNDQFRYLYWDVKPIDSNWLNYSGYFDLAPHVTKKRLIKISDPQNRMRIAQQIIENQTYAQYPAQIEQAHSSQMKLHDGEKAALAKRDVLNRAAISAIDYTHSVNIPRVGIAFSGGGLRAMYSSLGFSLGLEKTGILNTTSHVAGLSGSTWFLMKWLKEGGNKTLTEIREELIRAMEKGLLPQEIQTDSHLEFGKRALEQLLLGTWYSPDDRFRGQLEAGKFCDHFKCNDGLAYSIVDLWGHALARRLFQDQDKYNFTLSSLGNRAQKGQMPFPIFTAIRTEDDEAYAQTLAEWQKSGNQAQELPPRDYQWFEATPFTSSFITQTEEVRIPTWALGRKFQHGQSVTEPHSNFKPFSELNSAQAQYYRPEPSAGQLLGAFGSAFSFSLSELSAESALHEAGVDLVGHLGTAGIAKLTGGDHEEWKQRYKRWTRPTNLAKGLFLYDFVKQGDHKVELRDGGLYFNLPLLPLFNRDRNLDIIIVNDSSGNLHTHPGIELIKFRKYSLNSEYAGKKLPHDLVDEKEFTAKLTTLAKTDVIVLNDPMERDYRSDEMTLIYVPTVGNEISKSLGIGAPSQHYGTFKLQYERSESSALIEYNNLLAQKVSARIKQVIQKKTELMNEK